MHRKENMPQEIKIEIDEASYEEATKKLISLYKIADDISQKVNYIHLQIYKPDGVFIATEDDGSQWVMLEDFITSQQSVQRNAYGTGWLVQISNFIIKLGWFIAGISNKKTP